MSSLFPVVLALLLLVALPGASAQVDRVVVIKVDGLPERLVEQYAFEDKPRLPNIASVFGHNGTWFENFYVRGLSLSAPSWSLLDTGQHLEIRGNVEYDRYTLRPWDYLNFFPFYIGYAMSKRVDMPGVEYLDQQGVPLLIDRLPYQQRYQGIQLLQRGVRWSTLQNSLKARLISRPPKELFDEWQTGFSMSRGIYEATERDILRQLQGTQVRYMDYFSGEYDHTAHLTPDRVVQLNVITSLDRLVGRFWKAISESPFPETTALILVSDHGMNTSDGTFSQGYNLVDWFNSAAGGGHHVITDRHPMAEFKLKGLDPLVSAVTTPSRETFYSIDSDEYPTVILDVDGNERANIALRENALNVLHILLNQLLQKRVQGKTRTAVIDSFFMTLETHRPAWNRRADDLRTALTALRKKIAAQEEQVRGVKRKWTKLERDQGIDKEARRKTDVLEKWRVDERADSQYLAAMDRLLGLSAIDFDPIRFKITDVIPARSLGTVNSLYDLQNYVVGPGSEGMVLLTDGSLDMERSFRRINYASALTRVRVRNHVQQNIAPNPVESIAIRVPAPVLQRAFPEEDGHLGDGIWLTRGTQKQALLLTRPASGGKVAIRYVPVSDLKQDSAGEIHFERTHWSAGLPLELFEDEALDVPGRDWLSVWHSEEEWFKAVHRTKYSNGIVGLTEQLLDSQAIDDPLAAARRARLRTDMLVFANDGWNFNVRGFNPGGNHGSLLRASTHSVLLLAGGTKTGIPRGLRVQTPYDSLSFTPMVLALMGLEDPGLPGPVIREVIGTGR